MLKSSQTKLSKIPCLILAFEDVGSGRSMEVYYQNLLHNKTVTPIMAYTSLSSYNRAPQFVKNKIFYPIKIIDHQKEDCDKSICTLRYHRTNNDWFNDCRPYISFLKKYFGEQIIWVIDMPFPKIEQLMGDNIVQVFHGELFNIGVSYFDDSRINSFNNYARILLHGDLMGDYLHSNSLFKNTSATRKIGRVLDDSLYNKKFDRTKILKRILLDPNKKTILFSPSWESLRLWSIGNKKEDAKNLLTLCKYGKENNLNIIIRPHTILINHHNVKKMCELMAEKFEWVFFDDSTHYSLYGPNETLVASDIMITDLSSIASDFLGINKPVIFLYPLQKEINAGNWGKNCPTFSRVLEFSYAVKSFSNLYKTLTELISSNETIDARQKRQKIADYIFSNRDGGSGKRFANEITELAMTIRNQSSLKEKIKTKLLSIIFPLKESSVTIELKNA